MCPQISSCVFAMYNLNKTSPEFITNALEYFYFLKNLKMYHVDTLSD